MSTRGCELFVEVQDEEAIDLADAALVAALLCAGVAAEKEGPRMAAAVSPPIWFGKIRVASRGDDFVRRHVEAAREAATRKLRDAGCDVSRS